MMRALVESALRLRLLVVVLAVVFLVVGGRSASAARLDVFPEFAPPRVEIQTEAPGLSPLEVETLVTTPIERAVQGVPFLSTLRSKSVLGLSSVVMLFQEGTDLLHARQLVQERISALSTQLPSLAKAPVMLSPLSSTSRVLKIGVSSDKLTQVELTELARFTIRPRLMAVSGVANVAIWGQRDRQLQVRVDPDVLAARGVKLDDVIKATRDATTPAAAGYVDTPTQRIAITHAPFALNPTELSEALVLARPSGATVRLADVATVTEGHPAPIGDAIIDGAPGLLLIVEKQPWGNTLEVTRNVEEAMKALAPGLPHVRVDTTIFRPATFIERALSNLSHAVLLGCVLVVVILFAFLRDVRTAIVSVVSIPLSLVAAAATLAWFHVTLDTMTIAGLVIALGEVVDDAIIDVENIQRRLAQNGLAETPRSRLSVVLEASLEVRSAVVYATIIVVLVFMPVYFLDGLAGSFFRPLAVSYVLAVGASLVTALVVTPVLSFFLLRTQKKHADGAIVQAFLRGYRRLLTRFIMRGRAAAVTAAVALGVTASLFPLLGESFLPDFHETDFLMHWVGRPGTSVEEMDRITVQASRELRSIPGVRNFGSHIGRAEVADEVVGQNFAELWISLDQKADYAASVARIQATVDGYPGLYRDVQTYLQERMKEVIAGGAGAIVVRISGTDLDVLRAKANELGKGLKGVSGVVNAKVEPQVLIPRMEVKLDPQALQRLGLTAGDVRRTMSVLLQGTRVGEVYPSGQTVEVVVWGTDDLRSDVTRVRELRIPLPSSVTSGVRLGDIASIDFVPMPNVVQREASSRRIDVSCDAQGRDLGAVAKDVERLVASMAFPPGHHAEVLGEYAARSAARSRLLGLVVLALVGIALVLYADFRSLRTTAFLMLTLPFALVGGVVAVVLTGAQVSLGSLVGFVTVLGIAARNGILLVSHYRQLEVEEGMSFGPELIVRGATERAVPILMTALATGLALVPLVVFGSRPGNEIEHPMAIVILGGLVTSTLMNLVLVPALYLRFGCSRVESR